MILICKIQACPFRSVSGFCRSRFVSIEKNGMCKNLLKPIDKVQDFMFDGWRAPVKQGEGVQINEIDQAAPAQI